MLLPKEVRQAASSYATRNCNGNDTLRDMLIKAFIEGYCLQSPPQTDAVTDEEVQFSEAWKAYDRKDNKQSAIKAWNRLSRKERLQAMLHIPSFVTAHPDKQYRPMFSTYINQKRFLDEEIVQQHGTNQPTTTEQQQQRLASYAATIRNIGSET